MQLAALLTTTGKRIDELDKCAKRLLQPLGNNQVVSGAKSLVTANQDVLYSKYRSGAAKG